MAGARQASRSRFERRNSARSAPAAARFPPRRCPGRTASRRPRSGPPLPRSTLPDVRSSPYGLLVRPKIRLSLSNANSRSGRLVCASGIAPAARSRATSVASSVEGGFPRNPSVPAVHAVPATSMESLTEKGTPASGPSGSPPARRRSISCASSSARSPRTSTRGVDPRIHLRDPLQMRPNELGRRDLAFADQPRLPHSGERQDFLQRSPPAARSSRISTRAGCPSSGGVTRRSTLGMRRAGLRGQLRKVAFQVRAQREEVRNHHHLAYAVAAPGAPPRPPDRAAPARETPLPRVRNRLREPIAPQPNVPLRWPARSANRGQR